VFTTVVGSQDYLRKTYDMDHDAIVNRVCEFVAKKPKSTLKFKVSVSE